MVKLPTLLRRAGHAVADDLSRLRHAVPLAALAALMSMARAEEDGPCRDVEHRGDRYTVCSFDPGTHRLDLHLRDADGRPYGRLSRLMEAAPDTVFAMNGGMYRNDLTPVGLYVEGGEERSELVAADGWGNFHLLPNGVFFVAETGGRQAWGVRETRAFAAGPPPDLLHATQSGPMLVIDGALHPRFLPASNSLKVRNGVGVSADGRAHFAISRGRVRFHDFGTLFRDVLETPNALFLDGSISTFRAGSRRQGGFLEIGPIISAAPLSAPDGPEGGQGADRAGEGGGGVGEGG